MDIRVFYHIPSDISFVSAISIIDNSDAAIEEFTLNLISMSEWYVVKTCSYKFFNSHLDHRICKIGAGDRSRTRDPRSTKPMLCQLSYTSIWSWNSELNREPTLYESVALPIELFQHNLVFPRCQLIVGGRYRCCLESRQPNQALMNPNNTYLRLACMGSLCLCKLQWLYKWNLRLGVPTHCPAIFFANG